MPRRGSNLSAGDIAVLALFRTDCPGASPSGKFPGPCWLQFFRKYCSTRRFMSPGPRFSPRQASVECQIPCGKGSGPSICPLGSLKERFRSASFFPFEQYRIPVNLNERRKGMRIKICLLLIPGILLSTANRVFQAISTAASAPALLRTRSLLRLRFHLRPSRGAWSCFSQGLAAWWSSSANAPGINRLSFIPQPWRGARKGGDVTA